MGELQEGFITQSGTVWKKVEGVDGNTYHFRDGVSKTEHAYNSVPTQSIYQTGVTTTVLIPSEKGPGYERVDVPPDIASVYGQRLANAQAGNQLASQRIEIQGEMYDVDELVELGEEIEERYEGDVALMHY